MLHRGIVLARSIHARIIRPPTSENMTKKCYSRPIEIILGAILLMDITWSGRAAAEESRILTVENNVWFTPANSTERVAAKPNQMLKLHDRLTTEKNSRSTIRLADHSVFRINEQTSFELLPPHNADKKPLLDLKTGSLYFFSREKPADVEFRTPTAVGAIRGTEFQLLTDAEGNTEVALLDGAIDLKNEAGSIALRGGELARVARGKAPVKSPLLDAVNVIQWCLYYPAVVDAEEIPFTADEKNSLKASLAAYREGDLLSALAKFPADFTSANADVFHAALFLSVGRVDEANRLLASAPNAMPAAQALRKLIAAVQGKECSGTPTSASEWLAESYYLQAHSKLAAALSAARKAVETSPSFGFAHVRVAELEFSFGRIAAAASALNTGLKNSPRNAEGIALRGFLTAADDHPREALNYFDDATAIDGGLANAWLGRGLCKMRLGQIAEGRQDLQIAAALEPNRALLRCYLAKAWSEEKRPDLAEKDLRLAKTLDPNDPTAWFYSALLKEQNNQVNDAIRDLRHSQELNDNRSLFRSQLLLDQDRAVRSANLASIYRDAGMQDWSVTEAGKAVSSDYANPSAHLFLANSYEEIRDPHYYNLRYEAPARSEWLIGTLLAPVGSSTLSRNMSYQDYFQLFEKDGLGAAGALDYRSNGEWQQSLTQYGREGKFSWALDETFRDSNGQRANNEQKQIQLTGTFKYQLTPKDEVMAFLEYFDQTSGDVAQEYNPKSANSSLALNETQNPNIYLGYHRTWSPNSHTMLLVGRISDSLSLTNGDAQPFYFQYAGGNINRVTVEPFFGLNYLRDYEAYTAELQHILQIQSHTLVGGVSYQNGTADTGAKMDQLGTLMSAQQLDADLNRFSAYGYDQWKILDTLALTAGVTYDHLEYPYNDLNSPLSARARSADQVSPKGGLIFTPWKKTTFRASYSQSLGGVFNENSFRLEPTEIAGLNQSFRSLIPESAAGLLPGAHMETLQAGVDQVIGENTFLSVSGELMNSDGDRGVGAFTNTFFLPLVLPNQFSTTRQTLDFHEKSLLFTANHLLGKEWSLGAKYRLSQADLTSDFPDVPSGAIWQASFPQHADTSAILQQLALSVNFNLRGGFFGQLRSQWNHQENSGYTPGLAGDDFWQSDFIVGYRFHQRKAEVHIGVLNFTDQDYRLNPLNLYAELPRHITFIAGAKFSF